MNEMLDYMFHNLKSSEASIKNIFKALRSQKRINRSFVLFSICTTACAGVMKMRIDKQNEQIKALKNEVETLKAGKEHLEL